MKPQIAVSIFIASIDNSFSVGVATSRRIIVCGTRVVGADAAPRFRLEGALEPRT